MKHLSDFEHYHITEEIKLKDAIVGGALAASTVLGSGCEPLPQVRVNDTEVVSKYNDKFQLLNITAKNHRPLSIVTSEDGVISCRWRTGSRKSVSHYYTISVPEGTKMVFRGKTGFLGQNLYTKKEISDDYYDLESDLKFIKEVPGGKIFKADSFFDNTFVFVYDQNYNQKDNLFNANGRSYNVFLDDNFYKDIYFVIPVSQ